MKILFLSTFFSLLSLFGFAQYGLTGQYVSGNSVYGDIPLEDGASRATTAGYLVGLNYWVRLKNTRIEFFPEVNYSVVNPTSSLGFQPDFQLRRWGLTLPASFYLFDFKGDCDCPTFSKQNDLFKKGFFLQLLISGQLERSQTDLAKNTQQNLGAGGGIGLDIGISDFLTLTPIFQYVNHFVSTKEDQNWGSTDEFRAGIRVTFRPDYR